MSAARLYVDTNATPLSRTVWQPSGSSLRVSSPLSHLSHLQANRRELWQESTPTSHTFPHIRPPHRRRLRPRSTVRAKGSRLRRDLSQTLLSAYDAAKAPFRHSPSSRRAGLARKPANNNSSGQESPNSRAARPQAIKTSSRTVEITGPLNSPARAGSFGKKLFRQRSFKSSLASPLSSHPPIIMPFRRSLDMNRPQTSDAPAVPRRSPARSRDSFNRAKIHVRRPPKGVTHWFDALDEDSSDGDYPEVVDPPASAPPEITTFQPSLGPHRARGAPTSFLRSNRRRKNSAVDSDAGHPTRYVPDDMHGRSVLDLSSDEDGVSMIQSPGWDMMSPSPGPHNPTFLRRATMQRKGSMPRQSMATDSKSPRSPTIRQSGRSQPSTASMLSGASNTLSVRSDINYVAVTAEEMAVLEMLRRKRAAQGDGQQYLDSLATNFQDSITEEDEMPVAVPPPLNTNRKASQAADDADDEIERSHSMASTVTLESGENITFPTPPLPAKSPLLTQKPIRNRRRSVPLKLGDLPTPPPTASYWSPELPTPYEEISELEAVTYSASPAVRDSSNTVLSAGSSGSRRMSNYSLLHPHVFNGAQCSISPRDDMESPFNISIPERGSSLRDSSVRNSVTTAFREPRRTRTYDSADTRKFMSEFNLDFSELEFSPVPNLLSPSLGGLLTSTLPPADWPGQSPALRSATMTTRSPSCASHSPSLTDGASLSGRSRSELDTPIKEPGSNPGIMGDETGGFGLERLAGKKLTVVADLDSEETLGGGRYAIEIRKLADDMDKSSLGYEHAGMMDGGEGKRKASTEVLDAWNALGGYPIH